MPSKRKLREKIENVSTALEKVKAREGVIGYIHMDSTSAAVDLRDPSKTIEYAALSATTRESGEDLSKTFNLGDVNAIVLEGRDTKMLLLIFGDHRLSIFMDKNVDHNMIFDDLNLT